MIQGTGSDVGKSLVVAGLARAFTRRGLAVRPFKPQNMSNNAAVTCDGGEIGRAQALQARACGVSPTCHMNPVLLKPHSDMGAQVVVRGRVLTNASAQDYHRLKPTLLPTVLESYHHLCAEADLVLVEGAGSAAEVNLRAADIANMGFAEAADIPVLLVGDIDRGGVLAALVGTYHLLPPTERARIKGYVINKFRGDPALLSDGLGTVTQHTGWPCLGILPWFPGVARLPAEDSVSLRVERKETGPIHIVVPTLSRIANFDDFDPLAAEPDVRLSLIRPGEPLPADADVVILPGSKATIADLAFLRAQGWEGDILAHARRGGKVLGICAGYQMLGSTVADPLGMESAAGSNVPGLGLLAVETLMTEQKVLANVCGVAANGAPVQGYEMHLGETTGADSARPFLTLAGKPEGAISPNGRIMGTTLHGLFQSDAFRTAFLAELRPGQRQALDYNAIIENTLNQWASHLETHLDLDALLRIASERD